MLILSQTPSSVNPKRDIFYKVKHFSSVVLSPSKRFPAAPYAKAPRSCDERALSPPCKSTCSYACPLYINQMKKFVEKKSRTFFFSFFTHENRLDFSRKWCIIEKESFAPI